MSTRIMLNDTYTRNRLPQASLSTFHYFDIFIIAVTNKREGNLIAHIIVDYVHSPILLKQTFFLCLFIDAHLITLQCNCTR